jgi:hypothetical protein
MTKEEFLEDQLKRLEIKEDVKKLESLTVPEGKTYVISGVDPQMKGAKWLKDTGYKLKPKSIVDMKKWIGIPDALARQINKN